VNRRLERLQTRFDGERRCFWLGAGLRAADRKGTMPRGFEESAIGGRDAARGHQMAWKLYTRNENFREPPQTCTTHPSRADALEAAYVLFIYPSLRKTPFLIEGPDGDQIDRAQIEAWCQAHPSNAR
jgi:hypothetical protein